MAPDLFDDGMDEFEPVMAQPFGEVEPDTDPKPGIEVTLEEGEGVCLVCDGTCEDRCFGIPLAQTLLFSNLRCFLQSSLSEGPGGCNLRLIQMRRIQV